MFDLLEGCLYSPFADKASLVQLRGQKRMMTVCTIKNGLIDDYSTISLGGVGARALIEGKSWGFSSTSVLEQPAVNQTLTDAIKLSQASEKLTTQKNIITPTFYDNGRKNEHWKGR